LAENRACFKRAAGLTWRSSSPVAAFLKYVAHLGRAAAFIADVVGRQPRHPKDAPGLSCCLLPGLPALLSCATQEQLSVAPFYFRYFALFVRSSAALRPRASFTASSCAQKCM
jgi:hypothetical protein